MAHTTTGKKQLLTRVRRIKGQTEALERALSDEAECLSVLQQIAAIRGAVNGLMAEVLEGHLREHLGKYDLDSGSGTVSKELDGVINALRSYLK